MPLLLGSVSEWIFNTECTNDLCGEHVESDDRQDSGN